MLCDRAAGRRPASKPAIDVELGDVGDSDALDGKVAR
jgi:hypothetical protein